MIIIIELLLILFLFWLAWTQVIVPLVDGTPLFSMFRSSKERLLAKDLANKLAALRVEEANQVMVDEYLARREALDNGRDKKDFNEQQNSL